VVEKQIIEPPLQAAQEIQPSVELLDESSLPRWLADVLASDVDGDGPRMVRNDGITHINVGGRTRLGRDLSHFAYTPFVHPFYGPFNCMEGFWHYIRADKPDDTLRSLTGWQAKKYGRHLNVNRVDNFRELINEANYHRIDQNPELRRMFVECTLPLGHYYTYGAGNILIHPRGYDWILAGLEEVRTMMREGRKPDKIVYPLW